MTKPPLHVLFLATAMATVLPATSVFAHGVGTAAVQDETARAAMIRYEKAIRKNSDDMNARFGLAQALNELGEFDRAEKMIRVVIRRNPSTGAQMVLAESLFGQDRLTEAKAVLEDQGRSADVVALRSLIDGEQALRAAQPAEALKRLGPAVKHKRFATMARLVAARAQYARGDYLRAQRLVDAIIADGGTAIPTMLLRARLALKAGDPARAASMANDALARDPGNVSAGAIAIEAALRRGDVETAWQVQKSLAPREANDPRPAYLEALILLQEGKVQQAGRVASTIEPWLVHAPGGAVLLGRIKIDTDKLAQAEVLLRDRLAATPDDRAARRLLVEVYDEKGEADRADDLLKEGLDRQPLDPVLLRLKADRLMAKGRYDEAQSVLSQMGDNQNAVLATALAGTEDTTSAQDLASVNAILAATAALRSGEATLAVSAADRAVQATDGSPVAVNLLAAAQAKAGDAEKAKQTLEKLIAQHPDYFAAIANRASLDPSARALHDWLEKARMAGAKSAPVLGALAVERYADGDVDGALTAAQQADETARVFTEAKLLLPRILVVVGRRGEAVDVLDDRITAAGDGHRPFVLSASDLLVEIGAPGEATAHLGPIATPHADAATIIAAAAAFNAAGESDEAWQLLQLAHDTQPYDDRIGAAYLDQLARRDITSALKALETDETLSHLKGPLMTARLYNEADRRPTALKHLTLAPHNGEVFAAWAGLVQTDVERRELLTALQRWTASHPSDRQALLILSGIAVDLGDWKVAEDAIAAGLAQAPNDPLMFNNLALARSASDPDGALDLARRAYTALPHVTAIAETYADLLRDRGQGDAARALLRRARVFDPGNEELSRKLAALE
ncbi:tetratricopeptide repeat protein [Parvularcula sp. LCG005]|uniref:tetratricopeptide repeat protein n=1 Tax=Parvularcula sp. LCG005 TaxID=3078805 RepID=UPI002943DDF3|nr:tetratricopeptide repeat protein [Parvularcula sp. LCG005]WOI52529.1 tetratricopeptide repeat protein [Parvularcula sp. LCG005]